MTQTTNYNLNQWEAEDAVRREDFNADNAAIDAALKAIASAAAAAQSTASTAQGTANAAAKIAYGTYTGAGTYGVDSKRTLTFSFEPKFIFIARTDIMNLTNADPVECFLFFFRPQTTVKFQSANGTTYLEFVSWSGKTMSWYGTDPVTQLNSSGRTYAYLAIG